MRAVRAPLDRILTPFFFAAPASPSTPTNQNASSAQLTTQHTLSPPEMLVPYAVSTPAQQVTLTGSVLALTFATTGY